MAEREFNHYRARSGATLEGSRYTAYLAVTPRGNGFPMYFAICENRSFRARDVAEAAAAKALLEMTGLEDDGTPIFPDGYTGFDDDVPAQPGPQDPAQAGSGEDNAASTDDLSPRD